MGSLARIPLRPEMFVAPAVYQLDSHFDPVAFPQQAAFDDRVHAQLPRDIRCGQLAVPVADRRLPGRHPQTSNLRELRDQDVLETVDVIVLFRVTGQVVQRKHGQRSDDLPFRCLVLKRTGQKTATIISTSIAAALASRARRTVVARPFPGDRSG